MKMQRTQIYLEPELAESLDRLAKQRGTSRADLIRTAARRLVAEEQPQDDDPILGIIGLAGAGQDSATDVAERHDDYLAEIVMEKWRL
jgi:metal-responsive CopG/Arc/MetJ family transcriptional regulator